MSTDFGSDTTDSVPMYAGLTRRFAARVLDLLLVFFLAFVVGSILSVILAVTRPEGFQAYLEYSQSTGLSFEQLAEREGGNWLNCPQAEDQAKCQLAQSFAIDQTAITLAIFLVLHLLYFGILTSSRFQATVGKLALKIRVVADDLGRPGPWQAVTREVFFVLLFASSLGTLYFPSVQIAGGVLEIVLLISTFKILFSRDKTAIHDNLAYTKVILKK